jgi:hypothetical protein
MDSPGRPHALDYARCAEICELVAAGHSVAAVARMVGCNVKTIRRHAQRDEVFARQLRAAEVNARNDPLKQLRRAASSNWRAAAWLLERSDPERFGKQTAAAPLRRWSTISVCTTCFPIPARRRQLRFRDRRARAPRPTLPKPNLRPARQFSRVFRLPDAER